MQRRSQWSRQSASDVHGESHPPQSTRVRRAAGPGVDLIISSVDGHDVPKTKKKGDSFGTLNMNCGEEATYNFSFVKAGTNTTISVERYTLTIKDVDFGSLGHCKEMLHADQYKKAKLVGPAHMEIDADGTPTFVAGKDEGQKVSMLASSKGKDLKDLPVVIFETLQISGGVPGGLSYLSRGGIDDTAELALAFGEDGSGRQRWSVQKGGKESWYNIKLLGGDYAPAGFLSSSSNGSLVDIAEEDDETGRQRWEISEGGDNAWYHIKVVGGVTGDAQYLSVSSDGTRVELASADDESGRQRWRIKDVQIVVSGANLTSVLPLNRENSTQAFWPPGSTMAPAGEFETEVKGASNSSSTTFQAQEPFNVTSTLTTTTGPSMMTSAKTLSTTEGVAVTTSSAASLPWPTVSTASNATSPPWPTDSTTPSVSSPPGSTNSTPSNDSSPPWPTDSTTSNGTALPVNASATTTRAPAATEGQNASMESTSTSEPLIPQESTSYAAAAEDDTTTAMTTTTEEGMTTTTMDPLSVVSETTIPPCTPLRLADVVYSIVATVNRDLAELRADRMFAARMNDVCAKTLLGDDATAADLPAIALGFSSSLGLWQRRHIARHADHWPWDQAKVLLNGKYTAHTMMMTYTATLTEDQLASLADTQALEASRVLEYYDAAFAETDYGLKVDEDSIKTALFDVAVTTGSPTPSPPTAETPTPPCAPSASNASDGDTVVGETTSDASENGSMPTTQGSSETGAEDSWSTAAPSIDTETTGMQQIWTTTGPFIVTSDSTIVPESQAATNSSTSSPFAVGSTTFAPGASTTENSSTVIVTEAPEAQNSATTTLTVPLPVDDQHPLHVGIYTYGFLGTAECPFGYHPILTTAECQKAAAALGAPFAETGALTDGEVCCGGPCGSQYGYPGTCKKLTMNFGTKFDAMWVCSASVPGVDDAHPKHAGIFTYGFLGTGECPNGYSTIQNVDGCSQAATALGVEYVETGAHQEGEVCCGGPCGEAYGFPGSCKKATLNPGTKFDAMFICVQNGAMLGQRSDMSWTPALPAGEHVQQQITNGDAFQTPMLSAGEQVQQQTTENGISWTPMQGAGQQVQQQVGAGPVALLQVEEQKTQNAAISFTFERVESFTVTFRTTVESAGVAQPNLVEQTGQNLGKFVLAGSTKA